MYNYTNSDELPNDILHYYIDKNYVSVFNTNGMQLSKKSGFVRQNKFIFL